MSSAICPECEADVYIEEDSERGDPVTCEECGTDLEVVMADPPEVKVYVENEDDDLDDDGLEDDDLDDDKDDLDDDDDDDFSYDDEDEDENY